MERILLILLVMSAPLAGRAQDANPFDFGKMWTFENPPVEWFGEAYDMDVDQAWFDDVRMASLRFASWCSASFVSPSGLIMTNHHCSRTVAPTLAMEGEDFDRDGFYAASLDEERKAEGLYVEQLIKVDDITNRVLAMIKDADSEADRQQMIYRALEDLQNEYAGKDDWDGLRTQVVTYYSGGKFSIYGYKRYDDIRLVLYPEIELGFFGGDYDNFTYPRYNLDCTFWRAYDENGEPLNTADNYFKFNPEGISDGSPVFVIGNPGSTERYRTVSQLEYDRDFRFPVLLTWMKNRHEMFQREYEKNPSQDLKNTIFEFANSIKAYEGIYNGLNNPELFDRKVNMEKLVRSKATTQEHWDRLTDYYNDLGPLEAERRFLSPSPEYNGMVVALLPVIYQYMEIAGENPDDPQLEIIRQEVLGALEDVNWELEEDKLALVLSELQMYASADDEYIRDLFRGDPPQEIAAEILDKSAISDPAKFEKLLTNPKKAAKGKDEVFELAGSLVPEYFSSAMAFEETAQERSFLEERIANETFKVFGDNLPPDATFTLRISDGVVKGYEYNGTTAPYKTTYFGLYDRYYSYDMQEPWALPEKWKNPAMELLEAPLNFVSTNDIIGGNSGSPIINSDKEVVGLIFDGNIESLPGNFIFEEEFNRSVSVHAGGILAAIRFVYKADRIASELTTQ